MYIYHNELCPSVCIKIDYCQNGAHYPSFSQVSWRQSSSSTVVSIFAACRPKAATFATDIRLSSKVNDNCRWMPTTFDPQPQTFDGWLATSTFVDTSSTVVHAPSTVVCASSKVVSTSLTVVSTFRPSSMLFVINIILVAQ